MLNPTPATRQASSQTRLTKPPPVFIKDGIRTEYVVDKNTTYSRILTETNYKKTIFGYTDKVSEKIYTYGAGLLSEQRTGEESITLYYHYNHLGSTTEITDQNGAVIYRFAYGTYGELTAVKDKEGNSLIQAIDGKTIKECLNEVVKETGITLLYNGEYGVQTDTNGLYYMRARYYNMNSNKSACLQGQIYCVQRETKFRVSNALSTVMW